MKVVLLENVKRIGSIGEVIDVKRGYARNFLIANKKALHASKDNILQVEKIKSELSKKDNEKKKDAIKISEKINGKEYNVKKLSTENNELYGSVKPTEISKLIQNDTCLFSQNYASFNLYFQTNICKNSRTSSFIHLYDREIYFPFWT